MKTYKKIAAGMALLGLLAVTNVVYAAPFDWKFTLRNSTDTADYTPSLAKSATSSVALVGASVQYPAGTPIWYYPSSQFGLNSGPDAESRTLTIDAIEWDVVTGLPDMLDAKASLTQLATLQSQVDGIAAPVSPLIATSTTRTIATTTGASGWQISASRNSEVRYSPTIVSTASIAGNSSGTTVLEIAPTNATSSAAWIEAGRCTNGQALSLAITLQSVQTTACQLSAWVPAGYYVKLRSIVNAGTPTFSFSSGQEVLH